MIHQTLAEEVTKYYPIPAKDEINFEARAHLEHFPVRRVIAEELKFIRESVARFKSKGVLIGLSGGSDSSTLAALAGRLSLNSDFQVLTATIIVKNPTDAESRDIEAATEFAKKSGITHVELDASEVIEAFDHCSGFSSTWAKINRSARLRFDLLNCLAEDRELLFLDSLNRSEYVLGAFTEPLGLICPFMGLFKTEVFRLGQELGVPSSNLCRASLDSEKGVLTEELYGATWDILDPILYLLFDRRFPVESVSKLLGHGKSWIRNIWLKRIDGQAWRRDAFHPLHSRLSLGGARVNGFLRSIWLKEK